MLPAVKVAVKTTSAAFEPEIEAAMQAAIADMKRVGIAEACFADDSDYYPLVKQAVIIYCKAHFGQDNPNEEMGFWRTSYQQTVTDLINSGANSYAIEGGE